MTLQEPASMDECMYFTNRTIDSGKATAWVFKKECPKCKEGRLGKPIKKNGKPDKKSENYECPKCKYNESNEETEKDLTVNIKYTCPHCGKEGEATTGYERTSFKGVQAYVFECNDCKQKIGITKKMKKTKEKKKKEEGSD